MTKRRTGLQSEISSIFSGVPLQKERSEPKPDGPSPKRQGSAPSAPPASRAPAPRRQIPDAPTPWQGVEQITKAVSPKVSEVTLSEKEIKSIPRAVSRRKKKKKRLYSSTSGAHSAKQKAETIVSIFLILVLVVVLARPFRTAVSDSMGSALAGQERNGFQAKADIEIDWPVPTVYRTDIRDPMTLGSRGQIYAQTLRPVVRGIVYSEESPFAIVGIEMMEEGEVVQGATILKINPDSVVFEKDGKTWTQKVEGQEP
jgi:hypothetical protein